MINPITMYIISLEVKFKGLNFHDKASDINGLDQANADSTQNHRKMTTRGSPMYSSSRRSFLKA